MVPRWSWYVSYLFNFTNLFLSTIFFLLFCLSLSLSVLVERSGTCVHIDPLGTSAWNTLIVGKKRWVLFPPHIEKHIVKGRDCIRKGEDDEAIHYFTTILPRIKLRAIAHGNSGDYKNFECYEFTQHETETVFIPNGMYVCDLLCIVL